MTVPPLYYSPDYSLVVMREMSRGECETINDG